MASTFAVALLFLPIVTSLGNHLELDCGIVNHTLRIDAVYARSLVAGTVSSIAIVDPNNAVSSAGCTFTEEGSDFIFRTDANNENNCTVEMSTVGNLMMEKYVVQMFFDPPADAVVNRDSCPIWVFICQMAQSYNVSSEPIIPNTMSFIFETNTTNTYDCDITFYENGSYSQALGMGRESYMAGNTAYMRASINAPDNIVLILNQCTITNLDSGDFDTFIQNKCSFAPATITYESPLGQTVDVTFEVNLDTDDMNASNEFFTVSCMVEICDSSAETCESACGTRRRRNEHSQGLIKVVTGSYEVIRNCESLDCAHICAEEENRRFKCSCREGYKLQLDQRSCEMVINMMEDSQEESKLLEQIENLKISEPHQPPQHVAPQSVRNPKPFTTEYELPLNYPKTEQPIASNHVDQIGDNGKPSDVVSDPPSAYRLPLLSAIIALAALLCILMAVLIYQNYRPRPKPFNVTGKFVESLAHSGEELQ